MVNFCEFDRRENEAANLLVVNMVLIDRDSRELSNGCHIVILSNIDLCCEIPAAAVILQLSVTF